MQGTPQLYNVFYTALAKWVGGGVILKIVSYKYGTVLKICDWVRKYENQKKKKKLMTPLTPMYGGSENIENALKHEIFKMIIESWYIA